MQKLVKLPKLVAAFFNSSAGLFFFYYNKCHVIRNHNVKLT